MSKTFRFLKIACLSSLTLFLIKKGVDSKMHGFSYQNFTIKPPRGYSIDFQSQIDPKEILAQTFTYFNHGGESLVFESQDHKWVLKVFRKHRLYPLTELSFLENVPIVSKYIKKRSVIYQRFWQSLKLQAEELQDLTGLTYVNIPSKSPSIGPVTLIDPIGSCHKMDLSQIYFVIQEKGELFRPVYLSLHSDSQRKEMIKELIDFYIRLETRGLKVWDNSISRNMGWIHGHPFMIDTGSICKKPQSETIEKNLTHLTNWLKKFDADQTDYALSLIESYKTQN